jgi:hypothetical protein
MELTLLKKTMISDGIFGRNHDAQTSIKGLNLNNDSQRQSSHSLPSSTITNNVLLSP